MFILGGTIDIIVHEVKDDGTLRELHKANGGDWGGTCVDSSFMGLLANIVGDDVFHEFISEEKYDTSTILNDFEIKKRKVLPEGTNDVIFKIPVTLREIYCKKHPNSTKQIEIMLRTQMKTQVKWLRDKMFFGAELIRGLFDESCKKILDHMHQLFKLPSLKDVSSILLVGGFAESPVLQRAIRETFQQKKIVIPEGAGLAVLRGAVLYGHKPNTITGRVSKYTYGIEICPRFDSTIHPKAKKIVLNGVERCADCFSIHVRVYDLLEKGTQQKQILYTVPLPDEKAMTFQIYCSTDKEPTFTTDLGCHKLGKLTLDMPDISKGMDRGAYVYMTFGGTEIEVTAVDRDDKEKIVSTTVDFLG